MTGPVDDRERLARLALARLVEPGTISVSVAIAASNAQDVWRRLRDGSPVEGMSEPAYEGVRARLRGHDPRADWDRLSACGGRVLCPGDPDWPTDRLDWPAELLGRGSAPPWALFVRGGHDLAAVTQTSVAVVGARAVTAYGTYVAGELAMRLSERGCAVVSGAAYGVDGAAHRGALSGAAAPTVAVLACGVDVAYPQGHDRLLDRIAQDGLVLSEWPPGCAPTRGRFLVRNRVIAALASGTVVVAAALRSGSLSTAHRAESLGRVVMAVPGPVTSPLSAGCHQLLRQGAVCVSGAAEVLEAVGRLGEDQAPELRGPDSPRDELDETVRRILDAVPVRHPAGEASIARAAGVSALTVQQVLPPLLIAGLVERQSGGWRLTTLGAGGTAGPADPRQDRW